MKENFDDIIRRRWEEQDFPVDPAHREEMVRLLDGKRRKRGIAFWWITGSLILLIAGGVMLKNYLTESMFPKQEQPAAGKDKNDFANEAQSHEKEYGSASSENSNVAKDHTDDVASDITRSESVYNEKEVVTNSQRNRVNSNSSKSNQVNKKQNKISEKEVISKESSSIVNAEKENSSIKTEEMAVGEKPKNGEPYFKVELENPNEVRIVSNTATIQVFADSIEYDPWTNAIYHNGTVRSLNITKAIDPLDVGLIEFETKNAPGQIKPVRRMNHPVYLLAETGIGLVMASKPFYNAGVKWNLGGGLGLLLSPKVHLQLTGGYLMQDGGFDFERTSTVNQLSFGVRSEFNSLKPDRLHYVYSKLGVAYRFHRSSLNAHLGGQWLYGAQGTVSVVQQDELSGVSSSASHYAWLKTDGLRKWLWTSDISYGYMVFPKLYVQAGVTFQHSSLTQGNQQLTDEGYYWNGKTAGVQPFITLNYLLHGKL